MSFVKRVEHRRQPVVACVTFRGDSQRRLAAIRHLGEIALDVTKLRERDLGAGAEMFAESGRDEPPPGRSNNFPPMRCSRSVS